MEGLREAVERLPSRESMALKKAIQLYDGRKLPKALKTVNKVLDTLPEHPESLCVKAIVLQAMGNLTEALALSKAALSKNLKNVMCWHTQGILKQAERQNKEALKHLTQAYRLSPDNHIIQRDLSLLQLQLRQFEQFRDLRLKSLLARSSMGVSWVSYSISEYLCRNYPKAIEVLDSLLRSLGSQLSPVETSEVLLFRGHILDVSDKPQEAVSYLTEHERQILDKTGLKETQAKLYLKLEQFANAADTIYSLLEMNPESREYHSMLSRVSTASGIPPKDVYGELAEKYPKSHLVARIPLDFTVGASFEPLLVAYIVPRLHNGIPSLSADLKSLYSDPGKSTVVAKVIQDMLVCMRTTGKLTVSSTETEPPSTLMWLLYLQTAHYKAVHQYDAAMEAINEAIGHTPTVPDLYVMKGRVLKRMGRGEEAAGAVEPAPCGAPVEEGLTVRAPKVRAVCLKLKSRARGHQVPHTFKREAGFCRLVRWGGS